MTSIATFNSLQGYRKAVHETFFPVDFRLIDGAGESFLSRFETSRFGPLDVTRASVRTRSTGHRSRDLLDAKDPDHFVLNIVQSGFVRQVQFGRRIETPSGFMSLSSSRFPFESAQLTTTHAMYIKIPGATLRSVIGAAEEFCAVPMDVRTGPGFVFHECLKSIWREREVLDESDREALSENLIDLFASLCRNLRERMPVRAKSIGTQILEKAGRYIDSNLSDPELGPERIAKALHVSRGHLHAVARDHGPTIGRMILLKRLERSRRLLADRKFAHRKIIDVAFDSGFNQPAHFSRVFKAQFGLSPRAFRRQLGAAATLDANRVLFKPK